MINVRKSALSLVSAINPEQEITLREFVGQVTAANGSRTPQYVDRRVKATIHPVPTSDLRHFEGLTDQTEARYVCLFDTAQSSIRVAQRGNDHLVFAMEAGGEEREWIVSQVVSVRRDWRKVLATLLP